MSEKGMGASRSCEPRLLCSWWVSAGPRACKPSASIPQTTLQDFKKFTLWLPVLANHLLYCFPHSTAILSKESQGRVLTPAWKRPFCSQAGVTELR